MIQSRAEPGSAGLPLERLVVFGAVAVLVVLAARAVATSTAFTADPEVLSIAVAVDLIVVVPAAWWFLLVRGAGVPAVTVLPVFIGSTLLAAHLLPEHAPMAGHLWLLAVPAEIALVAVAGRKGWQVVSAYRERPRATRSFPEDFPPAVEKVLGPNLPARCLASEWVLLYFALLSWGRRPVVPAGARPFWSHRATAWPAIFVALLLVMVTEIAVVHLLVSLWNPTVAWALTGLGIYGIIWLVGDLQALRLRPTLLTSTTLHLRIGHRWSVDVPLAAIRAVRRHPGGKLPPAAASVTVIGEPTWILELDRPVELRGLMGIRRTIEALAIQIDGPDFSRVLALRVNGA